MDEHEVMEQASGEEPSVFGFVAYKLKVKPEDFRVEEMSQLRPAEAPSKEKFSLYSLEKSGWNTVDLLGRIARERGFPYDRLNYGGKKDRHASTLQYVTLEGEGDHSCREEGVWEFRLLGRCSRPMTPELITANRFIITLRSLHKREIPQILRNLEEVKKYGLPNYFDSQRFGLFHREEGLMATHLFRGDPGTALCLALTHTHPGEKRHAKERKRSLRELWGEWKACGELARTSAERRIFSFLRKHPADFTGAINLLPREELSLYLSAFQSMVWNEILKRLILHRCQERKEGLASVKLQAVDPLFYLTFCGEVASWLEEREVEVPGPRTRYADPLVQSLFEEVLGELGLTPAHLRLQGIHRAFLKEHDRSLVLRPEALETDPAGEDDFFKGRQRLTVRFLLPRGAYGTMVIKRLTLRQKGVS